jgi:hypothetical protein
MVVAHAGIDDALEALEEVGPMVARASAEVALSISGCLSK